MHELFKIQKNITRCLC